MTDVLTQSLPIHLQKRADGSHESWCLRSQWIVGSCSIPCIFSYEHLVADSVHRFVPVVGLVGGVGSGKSSLARWLAGRRSVVVIDGDEIGHHVLRHPPIQQKIIERFGTSLLCPDGTIDRRALGRMVFGTAPEQRANRHDLESIVHPEIRSKIEDAIRAARQRGGVDAVLLDAAVLFEAGWHDMCDAVVYVDVPFEQRFARVAAGRNWTAEQLQTREASQWPLDKKRTHSQFQVMNDGSVDEAGTELEGIIDEISGVGD